MATMTLEELGKAAEAEAAAAAATPTGDGTAQETPVEETPTATEETVEETPAEGDVTLRGIFKQYLGEDEGQFVDKYQTDEDLIKGVHNLQKKLGERDQAGQVVGWLQQNGISDEDLRQLAATKRGGKETPAATPKEWDEDWFTVDAKGNVVPTADAPPDFEAKATRWRAKMTAALFSPKKLKELLGLPSREDVEATVQKTRNELTQHAAAEREQQEIVAWSQSKRTLLYDDDGEITKLGTKVNEILASGELNPNQPFSKRAERALQLAAGELAPKPVSKTIPKTALKQTPTKAGTKTKLTATEFFKQYKGDPDNRLAALAHYETTGELPKDT